MPKKKSRDMFKVTPVYAARLPPRKFEPSSTVVIDQDPAAIVTHYGVGLDGTFVYAAGVPRDDEDPLTQPYQNPFEGIYPPQPEQPTALDVVRNLTQMLKEERDKNKKIVAVIKKALAILEKKKVPFAYTVASLLREALDD